MRILSRHVLIYWLFMMARSSKGSVSQPGSTGVQYDPFKDAMGCCVKLAFQNAYIPTHNSHDKSKDFKQTSIMSKTL